MVFSDTFEKREPTGTNSLSCVVEIRFRGRLRLYDHCGIAKHRIALGALGGWPKRRTAVNPRRERTCRLRTFRTWLGMAGRLDP